MKTMKLRIEMLTEMLGTWPANPDIAKDHIISKNPQGAAEDELQTIEDMEAIYDKGKTVFLKEDGKPYIMDYMMKGFLKAAALVMIDNCSYDEKDAKKVNLTKWTYKRTIDGQIFFKPRKLFLNLPEGTEVVDFQRTIRVDIPKIGERTALVCSEMVPAGTWFDVEMTYLDERLESYLIDYLDYGSFRGLGQWRNASFGQFKYERLD